MTGIVPSAEICYIKHQKDRGMKTLIAWFRAELALRDEATLGCLESLPDARLEECQNETEYLAQKWREARLVELEAVSAA